MEKPYASPRSVSQLWTMRLLRGACVVLPILIVVGLLLAGVDRVQEAADRAS